eukprot:CAMPEP_0181214334 /NCGR_PEP_ID=MMETSP1096-20121128/25395_1 /TAXON_ID=156174 ORGANISM="Chrysochromulina ericina, Strain CCMP281" /NCGR_SAMPLE_ID=MMETSP1096 /ASSEMBLY_ACC=CAM_ASM_000453 /LENGTH=147 /DNA_ID=CAMNT_0023306057 /DNA_START=332 /DNA_END=775 /DNA_ORIENTATION=+
MSVGPYVSLVNLGSLCVAQKKYDEAEAIRREVLERRRATKGNSDAATLAALSNLTQLQIELGKLAEAVAGLRQEYTGHIGRFGKSCANYLPQETKDNTQALFAKLMASPDQGAGIEGYAELINLMRDAVDPAARAHTGSIPGILPVG